MLLLLLLHLLLALFALLAAASLRNHCCCVWHVCNLCWCVWHVCDLVRGRPGSASYVRRMRVGRQPELAHSLLHQQQLSTAPGEYDTAWVAPGRAQLNKAARTCASRFLSGLMF
jgi:hypothetical protein